MAKTIFVNGTIVEPEWLNSVFLNGHKHDGANEDGHCDKIDIVEETVGDLPLNRTVGDLSMSRVVGDLPQTRIAGYSFDSFVIDVYPFEDIPVYCQKIYTPGENSPVIITLIFPERTGHLVSPPAGAEKLSSIGMANQFIPNEYRPNTDIYHPVTVLNDDPTIQQPGVIVITATGLIKFLALWINEGSSRPCYTNNFAFGTDVGWYPFVVQYPIIFD